MLALTNPEWEGESGAFFDKYKTDSNHAFGSEGVIEATPLTFTIDIFLGRM